MAWVKFAVMVVVFGCFLKDGQCDEESERFSFNHADNAMSMHINTWKAHYLEMDKFFPGNILYSDMNDLETSNGQVSRTFHLGLREAAGFHQVSTTIIIVIDVSDHCIYVVDRIKGGPQQYAGICGHSGYQDGITALFNYPLSIMQDLKKENHYIITDSQNNALRWLDISRQLPQVSTIVKSDSTLIRPQSATQDSRTGDLFVTVPHSVVRYDYATGKLETIAGSSQTGNNDGSLSSARFSSPFGIALLAYNQLVLADKKNNRLRLLDLNTNSVSTICPREHSFSDICSLSYPQSIMIHGNTMYVVDQHKIWKVNGISATTTTATTTAAKLAAKTAAKTTATTTEKTTTTATAKTTTARTPTTARTTKTTTTKTTTSKPACTSRNITVSLKREETTADVELEPGRVITLHAGEAVYKTSQGCEKHISVVEGASARTSDLCPGDLHAVTSPKTRVAEVNLTLHDVTLVRLPLGEYPFTVYRDGRQCSFTVKVSDHKIVRNLVFKAVYAVKCSLVSDDMTRSALKSSADHHFQVIRGICGDDCKGAAYGPAMITCSIDKLTIEWPTEKTFTADVQTVPADLLQRLHSRQKNSLPILPIFIMKRSPPIVYPTRTADNRYVEASLTASCTENGLYDAVSDTCI